MTRLHTTCTAGKNACHTACRIQMKTRWCMQNSSGCRALQQLSKGPKASFAAGLDDSDASTSSHSKSNGQACICITLTSRLVWHCRCKGQEPVPGCAGHRRLCCPGLTPPTCLLLGTCTCTPPCSPRKKLKPNHQHIAGKVPVWEVLASQRLLVAI